MKKRNGSARLALLMLLSVCTSCATKSQSLSCPAPIYPPDKVLDQWARYKDGTPEGDFVIDFTVQQIKLGMP